MKIKYYYDEQDPRDPCNLRQVKVIREAMNEHIAHCKLLDAPDAPGFIINEERRQFLYPELPITEKELRELRVKR